MTAINKSQYSHLLLMAFIILAVLQLRNISGGKCLARVIYFGSWFVGLSFVGVKELIVVILRHGEECDIRGRNLRT